MHDDDILGRLDRAAGSTRGSFGGQSLYRDAADEIRRLRRMSLTHHRTHLERSVRETRTRIIDALVEAGEDRGALDDLETWELIIKYRTDPTLFPTEGADR